MVVYPSFKREKTLLGEGYSVLAGVDEVGCGCLAGPVYAAAVVLPLDSRLGLIRDSKTLNDAQKEKLEIQIKQRATAWAIGVASVEEIDEFNIRQAAFLAMRRAIEALSVKPDIVLSDGFMIPGLAIPCHRVIKGDRYVKSIAAASIIAKTARDREMDKLDARYPGYGFAEHKGYGTKRHQEALKKLGPCEIHRTSYEPVRRAGAG
ncbi:MAG TPA: ribonuclease HII [Verrucomicrobiae bacterium]|nr:ribonuclease HII [Verrucomicrobiae bacterium]